MAKTTAVEEVKKITPKLGKSTPLDRLEVELKHSGIEIGELSDALFEIEEDSLFLASLMTSSWIDARGLGLNIPEDFYESLMEGGRDDAQAMVVARSMYAIDAAVRGVRAMHAADAWVRGDLALLKLAANNIRSRTWRGRTNVSPEQMAEYRNPVVPRREELLRIANELGVSVKRLESNMTTAKAWKLEDRYPSSQLSNSHHEVLNPLSPELRKEWAERAIAEQLSVGALRKLLREEGLSITVEYNEKGDVVGQVVDFTGEPFKAETAIHTIAAWYESERAKSIKNTPWRTEKQVLTDVLETFERTGLLRFPLTPWQNALATGNDLLTPKTTE